MSECFDISEWRGKIGKSPATAPFMPVAQYGLDSAAPHGASPLAARQFEMQVDSLHFLRQCQQRAIAAKQAKIASLSFAIAPIAPWAVLTELGSAKTRHFYYDSPRRDSFRHDSRQNSSFQNDSMVGLGSVVDCRISGETRFSKAQDFIDFWQPHFCLADIAGKNSLAEAASADAGRSPKGYFFCSATFFAERKQTAYFAPAYVFVPQIQVRTRFQSSIVAFNVLITEETDVEAVVTETYQQLGRIVAIGERTSDWSQANQPVQSTLRYRLTKDVDGFEDTVRSVLSQMRSQQVHKVVLSDVADVMMPSPVDVVRSLQALHHNHPHCTIFSVGNGQGQSFIGASPERLLRIANGELMTDALAGTTSRSTDRGLDIQLGQSLLHSHKERYEHRVVVEFILAQLRSLGLNPRYRESPRLLKLLNLQHLHTPIKAKLNKSTAQPLAILAKLHPTPAVAGVPHQLACALIREYETFDRGLYTAPIGWIDTDDNSEFIVGIRSALIDGCKARLYAGAGIVSGSEPKKELAEIRLKLQALLNALVCV